MKKQLEEKKLENERLNRRLVLYQKKKDTKVTSKPVNQRAPMHMRAKSDLGTLQEIHIDNKLMSSHRALSAKFNILFGQRMTPDDSKTNSARNYAMENFASTSGSVSGKLKVLLNERTQTHRRKWILATPKKEQPSMQDTIGNERRIVHIRRDLGNFKRENPHLSNYGQFNLSTLNSASGTKLDIFGSGLSQPSNIMTAKKILAVRHNLIHHLDAVRDIKFLSEDEIVSVSEVSLRSSRTTRLLYGISSTRERNSICRTKC